MQVDFRAWVLRRSAELGRGEIDPIQLQTSCGVDPSSGTGLIALAHRIPLSRTAFPRYYVGQLFAGWRELPYLPLGEFGEFGYSSHEAARAIADSRFSRSVVVEAQRSQHVRTGRPSHAGHPDAAFPVFEVQPTAFQTFQVRQTVGDHPGEERVGEFEVEAVEVSHVELLIRRFFAGCESWGWNFTIEEPNLRRTVFKLRKSDEAA